MALSSLPPPRFPGPHPCCFIFQVIDRILYKLDDLVRPYVHKILVVIEPLLIDEDYYARVEGKLPQNERQNESRRVCAQEQYITRRPPTQPTALTLSTQTDHNECS